MSIIRNITSISDLKRSSININYVYRGSVLVWSRVTPTPEVLYSSIYYNTTLGVEAMPTDAKYNTTLNIKS